MKSAEMDSFSLKAPFLADFMNFYLRNSPKSCPQIMTQIMGSWGIIRRGPAPQTKACQLILMIAPQLMLVIKLKSGLGIKINGDTKCVWYIFYL